MPQFHLAAPATLSLALMAVMPLAAAPPVRVAESVPAAIHEIQGSELVSPLAGSTVVTEGIVTARTPDGFFLQSTPGSMDADPATSQGLFVFTGATPSGQAAVGNHVRATGVIQEHIPAGKPHQMPLTRLADATLEVFSSGNTLPQYAVPQRSDLSPDSDADALERYEGMRLAFIEPMQVVGPVEGNYAATSGQTTANGVYNVVHYEYPRPFREPGLPLLDAVEAPAGKAIARNDGNPERVRVDSAGQLGAVATTYLNVGDQLENLAGVLHYRDGAYTLLPDPNANFQYAVGNLATAVPPAAERQFSLGWMKMRRLFDDLDDPSRAEPVMTSAGYDILVSKVAEEICVIQGAPDLLAVGDVENLAVLADIAAAVQALGSCGPGAGYQPLLVESASADGLDLGFLVAVRAATTDAPRISSLGIQQVGASQTFPAPDGTALPLFAQPPLLLQVRVTALSGHQETLSVLATQFAAAEDSSSSAPATLGWTTLGDRVRATRAAQALYLGQWLEARQLAQPDEMMAVVGGFESFQFSDGYVDVMGLLTGRATPASEVWLAPELAMTHPLDNATLGSAPDQRYTLIKDGIAQSPDHVLVNAALQARLALLSRHPRAASVQAANGPNARSSLRDALRVDLAPRAFTETDTHVGALSAPPVVLPSDQNILSWFVGNQGSLGAPQVRTEMRTNLLPQHYHFAPPTLGWDCSKSSVSGGSLVACVHPSLAAGEADAMQLVIEPNTLPDGYRADFEITAGGGYVDTDASNDRLEFSTFFDGRVDLALRPITTVAEAYPGEAFTFAVIYDQLSGNPVGNRKIVATIDALASEVEARTTSGFNCDPGVDVGARRSLWTCQAPWWTIGRGVVFVVSTRETDGGRNLAFHAVVSSDGDDRNPADNEVTAVQPISRAGDIAVTVPALTPSTYRLDQTAVASFTIETPTPGVSTEPRMEIVVDAAPADMRGVVFDGIALPGAPAWTCGAPVAHAAGKSRIDCAAPSALRHPQVPAYRRSFRVSFKPPLVPGQALATHGVAVTVSTASDDRNLANNTAAASVTVDQSADLSVLVRGPGNTIVEPGGASFEIEVGSAGTNVPRSPRATLELNAVFAGQDIQVRDFSLQPVACNTLVAPPGRTHLDCPIGSFTSRSLHVDVPTRPELAGRPLELRATVRNDLMDSVPANNTASASVPVVAIANLCVGRTCNFGFPLPAAKVDAGGLNILRYPYYNLGTSTALDATLTIEVAVQAARLSARAHGRDCDGAVDIGGGNSRVVCRLGDLSGGTTAYELTINLDASDLGAGSLPLSIEASSPVTEGSPANNRLASNLPVAPLVDLSIKVASKRTTYPGAAIFTVSPTVAGPPNAALSEVFFRVETPGSFRYASVGGPGWSCGDLSTDTNDREYFCVRSTPLSGGIAAPLTLSVPADRFEQIGRDIRVFAEHYFRPEALANDRTPDNNSVIRTQTVEGRSTKSVRTPAYGAKPATPRAPARPVRKPLN